MVYDGLLSGGKREGTGVEFGKGGLVLYRGAWKNGEYHGKGILYNDNNAS